ncbi:hypothetical protein YC2023_016055 [Brassica napus]
MADESSLSVCCEQPLIALKAENVVPALLQAAVLSSSCSSRVPIQNNQYPLFYCNCATIVALKERTGDNDGAAAVLASAINWWSNSTTENNKLSILILEDASFKLRHGQEEEASRLYEKIEQLKLLPGLKDADVDNLENTSGAKAMECAVTARPPTANGPPMPAIGPWAPARSNGRPSTLNSGVLNGCLTKNNATSSLRPTTGLKTPLRSKQRWLTSSDTTCNAPIAHSNGPPTPALSARGPHPVPTVSSFHYSSLSTLNSGVLNGHVTEKISKHHCHPPLVRAARPSACRCRRAFSSPLCLLFASLTFSCSLRFVSGSGLASVIGFRCLLVKIDVSGDGLALRGAVTRCSGAGRAGEVGF